MSDPSRRSVLEGALASAALASCREPAAPVPPLHALPATGRTARNVVLIVVDDQRFDALSFMGHPVVRTPHIDALAREGTWFANAFVTTSLCCPSRASMLTGRYAHSHGVLDNQSELDPSIPTYAQHLQAAGIDTAYVGKWHMGAANPHPRPGWRHWVGFRGQGRYHYPGSPKLPKLDRGFSYNGTFREAEGYVTDLLTDEAVSYLEGRAEQPDEPFCLVVAHKACHAPFAPAERHASAFADAEPPGVLPDDDAAYAGLPDWLRKLRHTEFGVDRPYGTWADFAAWYRAYHQTLLAVDESVGRVVDSLRTTGLDQRTLVLYVSDNGFMQGEKGVLDKRNAYEPSMRIPLIAWGPGLVATGPERRRMVLNIDLAPTILEAMGLVPPVELHGRSLVPLLEGAKPKKWRQDFLYEYFHERRFPTTPTVIGVRTRTHKLITYRGVPDGPELYDLATDPGETTNLAAAPGHAERLKGMSRRLNRLSRQTGLLSEPVWGRDQLNSANRSVP